MSAATHLFVYGSLRSDSRHDVSQVLRGGASLVGPASVQGRLYDLEWHPGAVPSNDEAHRIRGELYQLIDVRRLLEVLDEYEGCGAAAAKPYLFERDTTEARLEGGETITTWIYWYRGATDSLRTIDSGEWRP